MNDPTSAQKNAEIDFPSGGFPVSSNPLFNGEMTAANGGEKFVVFFLNEQPFAITAKAVAEITRPLPAASLPNSPEWLMGIASLRSEIVTILNLSAVIQKKSVNDSLKTKFIILTDKDADNASSVAFPIDRPGEILFVANSDVEKVSDSAAPFIYGKTAYKTTVLQLIDAAKLLASLSFS